MQDFIAWHYYFYLTEVSEYFFNYEDRGVHILVSSSCDSLKGVYQPDQSERSDTLLQTL